MPLLDTNGRPIATNDVAQSRATVYVAPVRDLTPGEQRLLETVFGSTLDYARIKVHSSTWLPFQNVPMTPNGEIYYTPDEYQPDFSDSPLKNPSRRTEVRQKNTFVHEITHAWQFQHGMNVKSIGLTLHACHALGACEDPYLYVLDPETTLSQYGMEQQAQIVADYYCLKYLSHMEGISAIMVRDNQEIARDLKGNAGPNTDNKVRQRVFLDYWLDLYELVIGSTFR